MLLNMWILILGSECCKHEQIVKTLLCICIYNSIALVNAWLDKVKIIDLGHVKMLRNANCYLNLF